MSFKSLRASDWLKVCLSLVFNVSLTLNNLPLQCLGPDKASSTAETEIFHTCILCQEEEELKADGNALVTAAYLQKSTVLSNRRHLDEANNVVGFPLLASDLHFGVHTSSCGHVMHADCWKTYFDDIQNSERNRSRLRRPENFSALKQVCELF